MSILRSDCPIREHPTEPASPPPAARSPAELRRGMTLISIGLIIFSVNEHFHVTLGGLIWINVIVAMALVALVPLMPRSIMNRREGQH